MNPIEIRLINVGSALFYDLMDRDPDCPSLFEWEELIDELTGDLGWDA